MNTNHRFASALRLTEQGLALRRQFLTITPDRVNALCSVADYMSSVAPQMMREFYDFQFQFPETVRFFEQYAAQNHLSLSQLRTRLENAQLEYFLQIFREARAGGRFGLDFMEKRLVIGHLHNKINLPVKWYLGSYALYVELLKKYLLQSSEIDYEVACEAMAAILTVLLYDIQAVIDSFIVMLLSDLCVNTQRIEVTSASNDITDHFGEIRAAFSQAINETVQVGNRLERASSDLAATADQTKQVVSQIAAAIDEIARVSAHQAHQTIKTKESIQRLTDGIGAVTQGARSQAESVQQAMRVIERVGAAIRETSQHVAEMGRQSSQISEMIEVINQIAFQTNLYQSHGQSLPIGYTPAYPTHRRTTYARTKTHSGLETHRRRTPRTLQTRTQHPHRQTPPSPLPAQTRHTHPTSRPHRGRLANVHSQVAHLVSHRGTGRTHPSHARGQPSHAAFTVDPRPAGTAPPARRYARLSHAPRGSRVVSRDTGRGAVGASGATALPSAGGSAQGTASDGGACGRCATGAVEKRGFREALTAQGVRAGQRVVFVDEMRVGLIGQVRRRWTVRGVRLCQRVERSYEWRYLQVAVDRCRVRYGGVGRRVWGRRRQWRRCRNGVRWG
jgi:methyl-accepting chemotaxis protein